MARLVCLRCSSSLPRSPRLTYSGFYSIKPEFFRQDTRLPSQIEGFGTRTLFSMARLVCLRCSSNLPRSPRLTYSGFIVSNPNFFGKTPVDPRKSKASALGRLNVILKTDIQIHITGNSLYCTLTAILPHGVVIVHIG